MDFFEAKDFFKNAYPEKNVSFDFDDKCCRFIEIVKTDGIPNMIHHVECNKVKVSIDGMPDLYVPIAPHRFNTTWRLVSEFLKSQSDVHFNETDLKNLSELKDAGVKEYDSHLQQYIDYTGLSKQAIEDKIEKFKSNQN